MIKWIFFDAGNVIINDDPAMVFVYSQIHQAITSKGISITPDELFRYRESLIKEKRDGQHYYSVAEHYLGLAESKALFQQIWKKLKAEWSFYSPVLSPIIPIIDQLYNRYNLGIIANQPPEVMDIFEKADLLKYFKVIIISDLVGMKKPHQEIFRHALEKAQARAEQSVMIGDRIDNDVAPAKAVGMKTLWFQLPLELKGFDGTNEFEARYLQSIRNAAACQMPPRDKSEQPDFTAKSYEGILEGVDFIDTL
jgi:5'-nucleotidase